MKFKVKFGLLDDAVSNFMSAAESMKGFTQRLEAVKNQLGSFPQLQGFQSRVAVRAKAADKLTSAIINSGKCLVSVRKEYYEAEKKANFFTAFLSWIKSIFGGGKKPGGKKPGAGRAKPTPASEREADNRMRNEALVKLREYENKWRAAKTEAEKIALLNDFLAEMQKILGTSANPKVNVVPLRGANGSFQPSGMWISINRDRLNAPDSIGLLKTIMHEARHAYQYEAAFRGKHPAVTDETRKQWKDNFDNYKNASTHGYDVYYNQPIERDAFWFAWQRDSK